MQHRRRVGDVRHGANGKHGGLAVRVDVSRYVEEGLFHHNICRCLEERKVGQFGRGECSTGLTICDARNRADAVSAASRRLLLA